MTDPDDTTSLQDLLAAHRRTLAILLRQLANLGANHAPPGVHNGIAEARAQIARLKAQLVAAGVAVDDQAGDVATPDEIATASVPVPRTNIAVQLTAGTIAPGGTATGLTIQQLSGQEVHFHGIAAPPAADQLVAAQARLDRMPLDSVPAPASLPTPHRMPLRRNPQFVGREDDLITLAKALKAGGVAAITTGIGGVGKTQLASEFAHRYGQYFLGGVFWLSFANSAGVDAEIAACGGAGALELYADADDLSQAEQVAKVVAEWAQELPRLLIFDNCDDVAGTTAEQQLTAWLPRSGDCRVLVTSRRGQWRSSLGIMAHHLDTLPRAESIALLRSHHADLSDPEADAIAAELGDLPLALSLAGSYLGIYRDEAFGQPNVYLSNLRAQLLGHRSLMHGDPLSPTQRESGVRAAFDLSYQQLQPSDPTDALAIAALTRAAYLAPGEPFPRELLLVALGENTEDEDVTTQRADALRRLIALGLLEDAAGGALRIHRLISVFARAATMDDGARVVVEQTLTDEGNRLVNNGLPARLHPLLAHLRHAMGSADRRGDVWAGALANALGRAEEALINYAAARPLYERALQITEQALGPTHPSTATSLNNLAGLLESQGDYLAARPLYERALQIKEQALGPLHPDTATSLNNLAYLLRAQGDYATARPLYERALAIREQALGPLHPATATSLNNLAYLLDNQGDDATARPLYERALQITEQALGPLHPATARSLNNLAGLLCAQGDYATARPLYERALQITEQALGPLHPATATSLNNLAYLLDNQGDDATARPLYERALAIREQALGPLHPATATSLNNLAYLLDNQGDDATARPLYERALAIREQALGPLHPATATSLNNLAYLLRAQGDDATARPLYERALQITDQALGPLHPATVTSLNNLAYLLRAQGDDATARPLYERALAIREQALGPLHPATATSLNNLAVLLRAQGDDATARPLYERALQITEQALGPLHPATAASLNNLAVLLDNQGDDATARPLYERALQITEQALGPLHPATATSLNNLAYLLRAQGDDATARPLYERALAICDARLGAAHPTTRTIRANLAALDSPPATL